MGNKKSVTVYNNTELDYVQANELARKTNMDRDEIIVWHREFIKDCPTGKLDQKSFSKVYQRAYPMGDSNKFCKICFTAFDKDKSGFIGKKT